nr:hypothetical protein [uncultured Draconibacterium sp.]
MKTILFCFLVSILNVTVNAQKIERQFKYRGYSDYVINKDNFKIYENKTLKEIKDRSKLKMLQKGATTRWIEIYKYEGFEGEWAEISSITYEGHRYSMNRNFMMRLSDLTEITTGIYKNLNVEFYSLKPGDKLIGDVNPLEDFVSVNILFMGKIIEPSEDLIVSKNDIELLDANIDEDEYETIFLDNFDNLITEYLYVILIVFFILFIKFGIFWGIFQRRKIAIDNNIVLIDGVNKASVNLHKGRDGITYVNVIPNNKKKMQFYFPFLDGKIKGSTKDIKKTLKVVFKRKSTVAFLIALFLPFLLYTHVFYLVNLQLFLFMQVSYFDLYKNLEVLVILIGASFIMFYIMKFIAFRILIIKYKKRFKSALNSYFMG